MSSLEQHEYMFIPMVMKHKIGVNSALGEQQLDLSWADGMVGAIPVFDSMEAAKTYALNQEIQIIQVPKTKEPSKRSEEQMPETIITDFDALTEDEKQMMFDFYMLYSERGKNPCAGCPSPDNLKECNICDKLFPDKDPEKCPCKQYGRKAFKALGIALQDNGWIGD